jgi:hypothetical protein
MKPQIEMKKSLLVLLSAFVIGVVASTLRRK